MISVAKAWDVVLIGTSVPVTLGVDESGTVLIMSRTFAKLPLPSIMKGCMVPGWSDMIDGGESFNCHHKAVIRCITHYSLLRK